MSILNKEFKNFHRTSYLNNNSVNIRKVLLKKGNIKHYPSSTKEWYNSAYNYYKNNLINNNNNIEIYTLLYNYFNYTEIKSKGKSNIYYDKYYTSKVYIGNPEIKQSNNKINITLYIYNKQVIYLYYNLLLYTKIFNKFSKFILNSIKYNNNNNNILLYIICKYEFIKLSIMFFKYKFNINNLLYLKDILYNIYNKRIELNIINLKYLYLDSNILATSVARKLKYKRIYILSIIRLALNLSKKSYINEYYKYNVNINNIDNVLIIKDYKSFNKNTPLYFNIVNKPLFYKSRIIFYYLNNKIVNGIKLQGAGRLTKRLTASRSMTKADQVGSLKNNKSSLKGLSTIMLKGYVKSNLQYTNINSYKRIGSYGIKSWISNN
jgi:hypothetical protein